MTAVVTDYTARFAQFEAEREAAKANRRVYFMRPVGALGPVKIGCTFQPATRLEKMMIWSPVPLEIVADLPGSYIVERRFHRQFEADRLHSEWFRWSPELQATIDAVAAGTFDVSTLPLSSMGLAA